MKKKGDSKKTEKTQAVVAKVQRPSASELEKYVEKYQEMSREFTTVWNTGLAKLDELTKHTGKSILEMLQVLKDAGYTRMAAVNKIVEDHRHLPGFSQKTIYRSLPDEEKRIYFIKSESKGGELEHLSNDKYVDSPTSDSTNMQDLQHYELKPAYETPQAWQEAIDKEKQENQELKIQLSSKTQSIMAADMEVAKLRNSVKVQEEERHRLEQEKKKMQDELTQMTTKMTEMKSKMTQKPTTKGKWDAIMQEGEIEIVVARVKPDGTSLYRELLAAMNAKPVFYLKAVVGTNAKDFQAVQAML